MKPLGLRGQCRRGDPGRHSWEKVIASMFQCLFYWKPRRIHGQCALEKDLLVEIQGQHCLIRRRCHEFSIFQCLTASLGLVATLVWQQDWWNVSCCCINEQCMVVYYWWCSCWSYCKFLIEKRFGIGTMMPWLHLEIESINKIVPIIFLL